ncbi:MAG: hypothetical protein ACREJD_16400 [Phycisphaerales bacterium]
MIAYGRVFAAALAVCVAFVFASAETGSARRPKVLFLHSVSPIPDNVADVLASLQGSGVFEVVDEHDGGASTPTLATLKQYDAVLLTNDFAWADRNTLGNVMSQYVDAGYGVVQTVFTTTGAANSNLGGTWSASYNCITFGPATTGAASLGTVAVPEHATMMGVQTFSCGSSGFRPAGTALTAGATLIASWSDGKPLVAVGPKRNRVDLGFYPASGDTEPGNWDPSTDGTKLLVNALLYTIRPKVLLAAAELPGSRADVQAKILSTGTVGPVDDFDASTGTPTLAFLQRYDAVMTWSNLNYNNETAMGNVLADYVDAGGGVVTSVFANAEVLSTRLLGGRWLSGNYEIIVGSVGWTNGPATLGGVSIPGHPIMRGVASFSGGQAGFRPVVTLLNPGGLKVAQWSDGKTLAAVSTKMYNRAELGFYPPSNAINSNLWDASTDGAKLMANALLYVSRPYVGLVAADQLSIPDPRIRLLASLRFSGVGSFDADAATPTLATLSPFNGMMTWTNAGYADSTAFGNTAADYVDAGGAVVSALWANADSDNPIYRPGGRWITEGYETVPSPLPPYTTAGAPTLGAILEPLNPVARFVRKFFGIGDFSPRLATTPLLRGRTILQWNDGAMLASIHTFRKRVDLGFWPVAFGGYDPASDGVWLAANALDYAVRHKPCPGDFNGDGIVEDADFVLFVEYYNDLLDPRGDLSGDGLTEDSDFVIFAASYDVLVCP